MSLRGCGAFHVIKADWESVLTDKDRRKSFAMHRSYVNVDNKQNDSRHLLGKSISFFLTYLTDISLCQSYGAQMRFLSRYLFLGVSFCFRVCDIVLLAASTPSKSDIFNEQAFDYRL